MQTAIIILEYNNAHDTINCLRSLREYNTSPVKVIVVDNGSTNKDVLVALESYLKSSGSYCHLSDNSTIPHQLPDFTFLTSSNNDGYAAGNNKGLRLAYNDSEITHVMILNSDTIFVEDIIPQLSADLEQIQDSALISPILYKADKQSLDGNCARIALSVKDILRKEWLGHIGIHSVHKSQKIPIADNSGIIPIELPSGSCMFGLKILFNKIGGFDEGTFLYYEENILWEKIKTLGKKNYLDTSCHCIHLGATSTRKQPSRFMVMTSCQSQYYFVKNYLNASQLQLLLLKTSHLITGVINYGISLIKRK